MSGILEVLEYLSTLDSWGSPSDVFTAISGFLTGLCAGPLGLILSRFIDRKRGKDKCSLTGACLNKMEKEKPKDKK